ncbi:hypothetical protein BSKO_03779 [Bryopsis sp. KO-2023]|nr:hypothetical protein BSKO_03779 [Bryopsis sp. KO-2023]
MNNTVRTFLRVRPTNSGEQELIGTSDDNKTVTIQGGIPGNQNFQFPFDNVIVDGEQALVYQICASEVIEQSLEGYNGTIMCYGQTGAGKTFTMTGPKNRYQQRGLIPRTLHHLFLKLKSDAHAFALTTVRVSYLEIYNESFYDLLDLTTQPSEITLAEDAKGKIHLRGADAPVVATEAEALSVMFEGERNRVVGEHQLNRESSRSHVIFMIKIERRKSEDKASPTITSKLNLVDLAGSERVWKTKSEGVGLKEAGAINRSLSMLERVILALTEKHRDHIPYRSSKLTHLLKDSLGGNCRTAMIANVWGDEGNLNETLSTCRFAQRMQRVQNVVTVNVEHDDSLRAKQLEREIDELKNELAMHDSFAGRSRTEYRPYNEKQRQMLREQVHGFLESDDVESIAPLELLSLRHMQEVLRMCKVLHKDENWGSRVKKSCDEFYGEEIVRPSCWTSEREKAEPGDCDPMYDEDIDYNEAECVGELDESRQLGGVGIAPPDARPQIGKPPRCPVPSRPTETMNAAGATSSSFQRQSKSGSSQDCSSSKSSSGPTTATSMTSRSRSSGDGSNTSGGEGSSGLLSGVRMIEHPTARHVPDKRTAFEDYKSGPGKKPAEVLAENKTRLKSTKKQARDLAVEINTIKHELDEVGERSSANHDAGGAKLSRELKALYRDRFTDLQMVRSEVAYTDNLVKQCTQELLTEFEAWFENTYGVPAEGSGLKDEEGSFSEASLTRPTGGNSAFNEGGSESGSGRWSLKSQSSFMKGNRRKVLSSLVDNDDPDAKLYYNAQRRAFQQQLDPNKGTSGIGLIRKQGSRKKAFIL